MQTAKRAPKRPRNAAVPTAAAATTTTTTSAAPDAHAPACAACGALGRQAARPRVLVYGARAECLGDAARLLAALADAGLAVKHAELHTPAPTEADVELRLHLWGADLAAMQRAAASVRDGHVMLETLNHFWAYTGERWFVDYGDGDGDGGGGGGDASGHETSTSVFSDTAAPGTPASASL